VKYRSASLFYRAFFNKFAIPVCAGAANLLLINNGNNIDVGSNTVCHLEPCVRDLIIAG
jgi:hypothetical protein